MTNKATYFILKELVFQSLIANSISRVVEKGFILRIVFSDMANLVEVISFGESSKAIGVQPSTTRVQFGSIFLRELSAKRVDGNQECTPISLECENLAHNLSSGATCCFTKSVKVFEVSPVEGVADDFDVQFIQIVLRDAVQEVGGY